MCPAKPALGFCRTLMSLALGVHSYQFRREETVFCHLQLGSGIQVWAESYVLTCLQGSFRLPKPAGLALPGKACGRSLGSMLSCVRSSEPTLGCCHHISAPQCPKWSALSSSADWSQGSGSLLLRLRTWTWLYAMNPGEKPDLKPEEVTRRSSGSRFIRYGMELIRLIGLSGLGFRTFQLAEL